MKKFFHKLRKALSAILWSLLGIALLVVLGFVEQKESEQYCKAINISIDKGKAEHYFVEKEDVDTLIHSSELQGKQLGNINISNMERIIRNNPFVENAEVYSTIDAEINIDVTQRNPLLRIINVNNESFYVDVNGTLMPASEKYAARVLIATGNITDTYSFRKIKSPINNKDTTEHYTLLDSLFLLAKKIARDTFMMPLTEQIYVNNEREFEIIPRIGKYVIVVGSIADIEEKFNKLSVFYKKGLPKVGWNQYSTINLKYKNQVVCTKVK